MSEWVTVGLGKGLRSRERICMRLRTNRLSRQKVWDSVRMSDRLGG